MRNVTVLTTGKTKGHPAAGGPLTAQMRMRLSVSR